MLEKLNLEKLTRELSYKDYSLVKPRGSLLEVHLSAELTKYNHNDRIKISRRSRRHNRDVMYEKSSIQYTILGKCISFRSRGINSSVTLRNVITLVPFEMTFNLFTRAIDAYIVYNHHLYTKRIHYTRARRYELRKHSPSRSQSDFFYYNEPEFDEDYVGPTDDDDDDDDDDEDEDKDSEDTDDDNNENIDDDSKEEMQNSSDDLESSNNNEYKIK